MYQQAQITTLTLWMRSNAHTLFNAIYELCVLRKSNTTPQEADDSWNFSHVGTLTLDRLFESDHLIARRMPYLLDVLFALV